MALNYTRSRYYDSGSDTMDSDDQVNQKKTITRAGMLRYRPPRVESDRQSRSPTIQPEDGTIMSGKNMIRLRPDDSESIAGFLRDRLELLQQQALKRLAKAWIKAICPKKQARFPYKSKHQTDDPNWEQKRPDWWPPLRECEYTEPDHIDKLARTNLCLHLLRLRPTLDQVERWNDGVHNTQNKAKQIATWTAFLEQQTNSTIFDALGKSPEPEEKLKQRQKVLRQLYFVAAAEEAYLKGERDGDDIIFMEDDDESMSMLHRKSHTRKRDRDLSEAKTSETFDRRQKKSKSAVVEEPPRQKARPTSKAGNAGRKHDDAYRRSMTSVFGMDVDQAGPSRSSKASCQPAKPTKPRPRLMHMHPNGSIPVADAFFLPEAITFAHGYHSTSSPENSPLNASFSSSDSGQDDHLGRFRVYEPLPHAHPYPGLKYEEPIQHKQQIQVRNVMDVPHPYFATAPNTPIGSPTRIAHFQHGGEWPQDYAIAQPMERYPTRMSVPNVPSFGTLVPVCQPQMVPANVQYDPAMPVEQCDQRSMTPVSDVHSVYSGYPIIEYLENAHHGLPNTWRPSYPTPEQPDENGQPLPFPYHESMPDQNFPANTLPASVHRGFTGYASGVGETLV